MTIQSRKHAHPDTYDRANKANKILLKTTFCDRLELMQLFESGPVKAFTCGVLIPQYRRCYWLSHIVATAYVLMSKHVSNTRPTDTHKKFQRRTNEMITSVATDMSHTENETHSSQN